MKAIKKLIKFREAVLDKSSGVILIEFALAVPFLVMILYFSLDAPKHQRWKTQMKNAAYMVASMIQNVSQSRADKRIAILDFKRIAASYGTTIFGGTISGGYKWGMINSYYPLGFHCITNLFYIKGTGVNKAKIVWAAFYYSQSLCGTAEPAGLTSILKQRSRNIEYNSTDIYKDLKINDGEVKMLLETCIRSDRRTKIDASTYVWGSRTSVSPPHSLFGFYLLKPKTTITSSEIVGFFNAVVIFTPRPGLFTETPPS